MRQKAFSYPIRIISIILIQAFFVQQITNAAPISIKPFSYSEPFLKANFNLPDSVALIEDSFKANGSGFNPDYNPDTLSRSHKPHDKTLYIIQDAHANESGQINISKTLDTILDANPDIKYIFLEAGSGDESLSFLKKYSSANHRAKTSMNYLRKGVLQGSELFNLTTNHDVTLWGVEKYELYKKSHHLYKEIKDDRDTFLSYLKKVKATAKIVKSKIYSQSLKEFDRSFQDYQKGNTALSEYLDVLYSQAKNNKIDLRKFAHLNKLHLLKLDESAIDFDLANRQQAEAILSLPTEAQKILLEPTKRDGSATQISQRKFNDNQGFVYLLKDTLLKNDINIKVSFPDLYKYLEYAKRTKDIDSKETLSEMDKLESLIFKRLVKNKNQSILVEVSKNVDLLDDLFNLKLTPDNFKTYLKNKNRYDIAFITGFLNRQIMDIKKNYESTLFLKDGYRSFVEKAEQFYRLTYDRDVSLVENALNKMDIENEGKAVLIAGGFHSQNLKHLLKKKNVSYISIIPRVFYETDKSNYEKILLSYKMTDALMAPHFVYASQTRFTPQQVSIFLSDYNALDARVELNEAFDRHGFNYSSDFQLTKKIPGFQMQHSDGARLAKESKDKLDLILEKLNDIESAKRWSWLMDALVAGFGITFGIINSSKVSEIFPEEASPVVLSVIMFTSLFYFVGSILSLIIISPRNETNGEKSDADADESNARLSNKASIGLLHTKHPLLTVFIIGMLSILSNTSYSQFSNRSTTRPAYNLQAQFFGNTKTSDQDNKSEGPKETKDKPSGEKSEKSPNIWAQGRQGEYRSNPSDSWEGRASYANFSPLLNIKRGQTMTISYSLNGSDVLGIQLIGEHESEFDEGDMIVKRGVRGNNRTLTIKVKRSKKVKRIAFQYGKDAWGHLGGSINANMIIHRVTFSNARLSDSMRKKLDPAIKYLFITIVVGIIDRAANVSGRLLNFFKPNNNDTKTQYESVISTLESSPESSNIWEMGTEREYHGHQWQARATYNDLDTPLNVQEGQLVTINFSMVGSDVVGIQLIGVNESEYDKGDMIIIEGIAGDNKTITIIANESERVRRIVFQYGENAWGPLGGSFDAQIDVHSVVAYESRMPIPIVALLVFLLISTFRVMAADYTQRVSKIARGIVSLMHSKTRIPPSHFGHPGFEDLAFLYDQAVNALVLKAAGKHRQAEQILDYFALKLDISKSTVLNRVDTNNIYGILKIIGPTDSFIQTGGNVVGFINALNRTATVSQGAGQLEWWTTPGPVSFMILAMLHVNPDKYERHALMLGEVLLAMQSPDGGVRDGDRGPGKVHTEPHMDAFASFLALNTTVATKTHVDAMSSYTQLHKLTGDAKWKAAADKAYEWFENNVFFPDEGIIYQGIWERGPSTIFATDAYSWTMAGPAGDRMELNALSALSNTLLRKSLTKITMELPNGNTETFISVDFTDPNDPQVIRARGGFHPMGTNEWLGGVILSNQKNCVRFWRAGGTDNRVMAQRYKAVAEILTENAMRAFYELEGLEGLFGSYATGQGVAVGHGWNTPFFFFRDQSGNLVRGGSPIAAWPVLPMMGLNPFILNDDYKTTYDSIPVPPAIRKEMEALLENYASKNSFTESIPNRAPDAATQIVEPGKYNEQMFLAFERGDYEKAIEWALKSVNEPSWIQLARRDQRQKEKDVGGLIAYRWGTSPSLIPDVERAIQNYPLLNELGAAMWGLAASNFQLGRIAESKIWMERVIRELSYHQIYDPDGPGFWNALISWERNPGNEPLDFRMGEPYRQVLSTMGKSSAAPREVKYSVGAKVRKSKTRRSHTRHEAQKRRVPVQRRLATSKVVDSDDLWSRGVPDDYSSHKFRAKAEYADFEPPLEFERGQELIINYSLTGSDVMGIQLIPDGVSEDFPGDMMVRRGVGGSNQKIRIKVPTSRKVWRITFQIGEEAWGPLGGSMSAKLIIHSIKPAGSRFSNIEQETFLAKSLVQPAENSINPSNAESVEKNNVSLDLDEFLISGNSQDKIAKFMTEVAAAFRSSIGTSSDYDQIALNVVDVEIPLIVGISSSDSGLNSEFNLIVKVSGSQSSLKEINISLRFNNRTSDESVYTSSDIATSGIYHRLTETMFLNDAKSYSDIREVQFAKSIRPILRRQTQKVMVLWDEDLVSPYSSVREANRLFAELSGGKASIATVNAQNVKQTMDENSKYNVVIVYDIKNKELYRDYIHNNGAVAINTSDDLAPSANRINAYATAVLGQNKGWVKTTIDGQRLSRNFELLITSTMNQKIMGKHMPSLVNVRTDSDLAIVEMYVPVNIIPQSMDKVRHQLQIMWAT